MVASFRGLLCSAAELSRCARALEGGVMVASPIPDIGQAQREGQAAG